MIGMLEKLEETVAFVRQRTASRPTVGVILGSGLGQLVERMEDATAIDYCDVPHFPAPTVAGHAGRTDSMQFTTQRQGLSFSAGWSRSEDAFATLANALTPESFAPEGLRTRTASVSMGWSGWSWVKSGSAAMSSSILGLYFIVHEPRG